jgi:hypothetical protein
LFLVGSFLCHASLVNRAAIGRQVIFFAGVCIFRLREMRRAV